MDAETGSLIDYRSSPVDTDLCLPQTVRRIPGDAIHPGETSVFIPSSVEQIDDTAFQSATDLNRIEVDPNNPRYYSADGVLYERGGRLAAVPQAIHLEALPIPENTVTLGRNAFCAQMYSRVSAVYIPNSVVNLEDGWTNGLSPYCDVYGPMSGPVADAAHALELNYNRFLVVFADGNDVIAALTAEAGTTIPELRPLEKDGANFVCWSLERNGAPAGSNLKVAFGGTTLYAVWENAIDGGPVDMDLPAALTRIEAEAFSGISAGSLRIPDRVRSIGNRAFSDCPNLVRVIIPESVESIADDAFEGCARLTTICCAPGSFAWQWARNNDYETVAP